MIKTLEQAEKHSAGGKAAALGQMKTHGLPVPEGFVLTREVWDRVMAPAEEEIAGVLAAEDAAEEKSRRLQAIVAALPLNVEITGELATLLRPEKCYAVRSSGIQEDMPLYSFAGQYTTVLNAQGVQEIAHAVMECYASAFSVEVLEYLHQKDLPVQGLAMAVIIQEMVPAEKSGVVFTLNPLTGEDHQMVIEVTEGLGEQLVQGRVEARRLCWDWMTETVTERTEVSPLTTEELTQLTTSVLQVMDLFGYPCDIEFAIANENVQILQARPITKVMHHGLRDVWTTADFKDGGVSAIVCPTFMWSLYEYAWENSFCGFLRDSRLIPPEKMRKAGEMYYGRPYWNLSMAKEAMACVPGYREREFDSEYGISGSYTGDGAVTRYTPGVLMRLLGIARAYGKIVKERLENIESIHRRLADTCRKYEKQPDTPRDGAQWELDWRQLTQKAYLTSEDTYFRQIFINTVEQALFKDSILKHTNQAGYFALIGGLDQISHLLPFYEMWDITRRIRREPEALNWWQISAPKEVAAAAAAGRQDYCLGEFSGWLKKYGYHSERELDITHPSFSEAPETVAEQFAQTLALEDDCDPGRDRARQKALFNAEMAKIRSSRKGDKLAAKVERMRNLLWWREEFRDISTRYYHIIRQYSLELGRVYEESGVLARQEDIWFLKIGDIWSYMDGEKTHEDLRRTVTRNRRYYRAYRHYTSDNEIGADFAAAPAARSGQKQLCGTPCTVGSVTGTARVVAGLEEIHRLEPGDILVTRFTDTGWTSKFAMLGGVVTEYGGMLCHAAIVSREYGLPCVVCVGDATVKIPDGAQIRLDGATGEILIL